MAKTRKYRKNKRKTRKGGSGSNPNQAINVSESPQKKSKRTDNRTFNYTSEDENELPKSEGFMQRTECNTPPYNPPDSELNKPYENNLDPGTIILRLEVHGEIISNNGINGKKVQTDLVVPPQIEYLQTVTLGTPGCVNFANYYTEYSIMEQIIAKFRDIKNDELIPEFVDKCREINGLYTERENSIIYRNKKYKNSKYEYYKYETGDKVRADKRLSYESTCYSYRCFIKQHCKGVFVIKYKLPSKNENSSVGLNKGDFPNHILELPDKYYKEYGDRYEITLSELLQFLADKGYTKVFIYDDSCNGVSGCKNCNLPHNVETRFHLGTKV